MKLTKYSKKEMAKKMEKPEKRIFKAISLKQPWAELVISGVQDIINQSWALEDKYLIEKFPIPILIHASKVKSHLDWEKANRIHIYSTGSPLPDLDTYKYNKILGFVFFSEILKDCKKNIWYEKGSLGWKVKQATRLNPPLIEVAGEPGLFDVPITLTKDGRAVYG